MADSPPSTRRSPSTNKRAAKAAKKPALTARTADKHVLYQRSVQAPEADAATYARWFKKYTGRERNEIESLRKEVDELKVEVAALKKQMAELQAAMKK